MIHPVAPIAAIACVLGLLAGCSGSDASSDAASTGTDPTAVGAGATTDGLPAFYAVPEPLPPGEPGEVIATTPIATDGVDGSVWRVMYHSESLSGTDIAVSGLVAVPGGEPPAGGWPVVSWAHGTTGIADVCAPSLDPASLGWVANDLLRAGYLVAATDYEGLGTPGRHPYLVGESEGRGVIDIVRAATHIPEARAGSRYAVWGHSQGGHAALFAGLIADGRAPELQLVGVVAAAPPSRLRLLYRTLGDSPFWIYPMMLTAGTHAAFGDAAPLDEVLTPEGIDRLGAVDEVCASGLGDAWSSTDLPSLQRADPATVPAWSGPLDASDATLFDSALGAPVLLVHGQTDGLVPPASSQAVFDHLCALGQVAQRWVYPERGHAEVVPASFDDVVTWLGDRFADRAAPDPTRPTGPPAPTTESCPAS